MQITHAYRLRWQVELLFKEWKSYANLHAFDTNNAAIAEGMIWAAIGAALLKRLLAHATQHVHAVEISTRKVAMCAHHVLRDIFAVLASGQPRRLRRVLAAALDYLACNALRAHPKRDRRSGRLYTGFEPVFGGAEVPTYEAPHTCFELMFRAWRGDAALRLPLPPKGTIRPSVWQLREFIVGMGYGSY